MSAPALPWDLVGRVARSFALTLRLLPSPVRPSITLAYLLARISDTEADGPSHEADRLLLARKNDLLAWLAASPDADLIQAVWTTIQEGQNFDRRRFPAAEALAPDELDHYTFLVAGSVGLFWTRLCARHIHHFARRPAGELEPLAVDYGKSLQLVNILRDRKKDAAIGRIYLAPGSVGTALARARAGLDSAAIYIEALLPGRLRAATALPAAIASETLDLVEQHPDSLHAKISRRRVYWLLARTLLAQMVARP